MSDCNVCITSDYGEWGRFSCLCEITFSSCSQPKARKAHRCCECGKAIQPGQNYERYTGKCNGALYTCATCLVCAEIRTKFHCGGSWLFETLWDDMREEVFPSLTTGCLEGLSAIAKVVLIRRWNEWKFEL